MPTLTQEIGELESEVEQLRGEKASLVSENEILRGDNERLTEANRKLSAERDWYMRRSSEIKALLDTVGSIMVQGVNKINHVGYPNGAAPVKVEPMTDEEKPLMLQDQNSNQSGWGK